MLLKSYHYHYHYILQFNWDVFLTSLIAETIATVTDDFELINADSEYLSKALWILANEPPR